MRAREFITEAVDMALMKQVADASGISNPNVIKVGQKVRLPDGTTYTVVAGDSLGAIVAGRYKGAPPIKTDSDFDQENDDDYDPGIDGDAEPATTATSSSSGWTDSSGNAIRSGDGSQVKAGTGNEKQIKPVDGRVTSPYGIRKKPKARASANHRAVDFGVPVGTPVKAPISGQVTQAVISNDDCGGTIAISNGTVQHRFCHCSKINVRVGDTVEQGDIVGLTGGGKGDPGAGTSTGPHLHWEKKLLATNQLVNPLA
jgi:murein DD-endopeptidase MepM/ murein hydrolase activator NlpD